MIGKTKVCDWCKKRRKVIIMYLLGKFEGSKDYWICDKCNLIHDIV